MFIRMLCFLFSALIVALDQFFKHWIIRTLEIGDVGPEIVPGVLGLTRWENDGAMLNILSGRQWLLAVVALIAIVALVFILLRYNEGFWGTISLAAVLGGATGNFADRIFNEGRVIDMFRTLFINFPIFNIADIFITLGFITFLIHFIIVTVKTTKKEPASESSTIGRQPSRDIPYDDDLSDIESIVSEQNTREAVYIPQQNPTTAAQEESYRAQSAAASQPYTSAAQGVASHVTPIYPAAPPQEDYSSNIPDYDTTADITPDLSFSLGSLGSELGSIEEYNIDDILREYGLENNDTDV